jgi:ribosome maturation factor RimP
MREVRERLRSMLRPGIEALGFELVDVELAGSPRHPTVRVYIDSPQGITVDDCAQVSRQLSSILDVEDPLPGSFTLEVSSPGLDRPLVTQDDFRKRIGDTIKVKLRMPDAEGRRHFTGRLMEVSAERIMMEVDKEQHALTLDAIDKARLVPSFK